MLEDFGVCFCVADVRSWSVCAETVTLANLDFETI